MNGTDRHARSIFTIQINSCQDGTKRVETTNNKFQVRCLQALSARSVAAKRSIWFGRLRASLCATPNVGMIVGSERRNADHIMISMGLGGCRPSQAVGSLTRQRSGASATARCAIAAPPAKSRYGNHLWCGPRPVRRACPNKDPSNLRHAEVSRYRADRHARRSN